ncbi:alpha/beta fold hydrolase [Chryseobacterium tongliaoense]|uniref:alpha/beta fold hydrolase n=1 Tax=Chryseobacterium tongliaoense TaxID=3240933 RepID=UPI0035148A84
MQRKITIIRKIGIASLLVCMTVNTAFSQSKKNKTMDSKNEKVTVYTQETAPTQYIEVKGTKYAYRSFGQKEGIPLVFFIHFVATMDDWDPAVINPLAEKHPIILLDNKGVGGSAGTTPETIEGMAADAADVIRALGHKKVNLLGFSIGGFVAQVVSAENPDLVNKVILAGTGHKGGKYTANILKHVEAARKAEPENPRLYLFFSPSATSQKAGLDYTERLQKRIKEDRVPAFTQTAIQNQAAAIIRWGSEQDEEFTLLKKIRQPALIVNGNNDIMVATQDSYNMVQNIPNAKLVIWSDSGHGALYQYHNDFTSEVNSFLKD